MNEVELLIQTITDGLRVMFVGVALLGVALFVVMIVIVILSNLNSR